MLHPATERRRIRAFRAIAPMGGTDVSFSGLLWRRGSKTLPFPWNKGTGRRVRVCPFAQFLPPSRRDLAGAPAITCDGVQISYADLDLVSTRISAQLRHDGLRQGQVVGLVAHRSIEATAAILGILKAGGAYLPLDAPILQSC